MLTDRPALEPAPQALIRDALRARAGAWWTVEEISRFAGVSLDDAARALQHLERRGHVLHQDDAWRHVERLKGGRA